MHNNNLKIIIALTLSGNTQFNDVRKRKKNHPPHNHTFKIKKQTSATIHSLGTFSNVRQKKKGKNSCPTNGTNDILSTVQWKQYKHSFVNKEHTK